MGISANNVSKLRNTSGTNTGDEDVSSLVSNSSQQALANTANALTNVGSVITLSRGDGTTDVVTVPDTNSTYTYLSEFTNDVGFLTSETSHPADALLTQDIVNIGNLSGTNTGDQTTISGNAGSATSLETARLINGVSFDGSSDITINAVDSIARIASSEKASANGVATLDDAGLVPSNQLPSYVDDVLEYANLGLFPATGESGKVYIAIDSNITYRWSGTIYAAIGSDLAIGETSTTAYRGDFGKIAYDHSQIVHAPSNADNTAANETDPVFTASSANSITAQHIIDLDNLSGTNSGDQDLSGLQVTSAKGAINGYASLGADGLVPIDQLPPSAGGVILGETSTTAHRGDHGKIGYDHTLVAHAPANADNTSANETSHLDVLVDGDFTTAGFMKTNGAGLYSIDSSTYLTSETAHPSDDLVAQDIINIGNLSGINTGDQVLPVNADFTHDGLSGISADEHIDWTLPNIKNIDSSNYTDTVYTHPTTTGNRHLPSGGTPGQVIVNTADGDGSWQDAPSGGQAYTESNTAPVSPAIGDEWLNLDNGLLYKRVSDGVDEVWIDATGAGTALSDFDGVFANLVAKPTTLAGYGITDSFFDGAYSSLSGTPVLFDETFDSLTGKPTTLAGYGITDSFFDGAFTSLSAKPTTIAGYGITDAFNGVFGALTAKPTTLAGYGITDAFDGAFTSLSDTPTTLAGYGITDTFFDGSFTSLTDTPTTLAGYGVTDTFFDGEFSSLTSKPTTVDGYGITDIPEPFTTGKAIAMAIVFG